MTENEIVSRVLRQYQELSTTRSSYEAVWDEISEFVLPSRGSYSFRDTRTDPERRSRRRFDNTPIIAARNLTARIISEMTNSGTRWFDYRDRNPENDAKEPVRRFLQEVSDDVYNILNSGSFRLAHIEATADWIAYGTACMMKEETDEGLVFRSVPVQELYIAEDKTGTIDLVIRKFKLSCRQLVDHFGVDALPDSMKATLDKNIDVLYEVLHTVMPNDEYAEGKKHSKYFKFKSCYVLLSHKTLLKEGGFKRMPYKVFRFWKRPTEVYGGSPAIDALADIRMLNLMEEANIRSIQLEAFPPLVMAHDSVIAPLKVVPNGTNYGGIDSNGRRLVDRLLPPGNAGRGGLENMLEQKRQAIRSAFFVDPLINRENSIRTAAEVMKRSNEEMIGISPFLARYEVEYLTPILDDLLDFIIRTEETEIPEELDGRVPFIEYTGPLAKTQRAQELNNTMQFLQIVQGVAQVDPSILQNLDINQAFMRFADLLGVPMQIIRNSEEVAMEAQMAQQQQQAQMMDQGMSSMASNMSQLAKAGLVGREDMGLQPLQQG